MNSGPLSTRIITALAGVSFHQPPAQGHSILSEMKGTRLIFYFAILLLLMFLYFSIGDILYSTISADGLPLLMVVYVMAPLTLVLGFIRLWLLKPLNQRQRSLDIHYFAMPVLMIIACFTGLIWVGIILSVLGGVLIVYEFIRSIIKLYS